MTKSEDEKKRKKDVYIKIGKRLKEARIALELTQEKFGDAMGIARGTVSNLECGSMNPADPKHLKCFEAFYNINPKWLLNGEGEMFLIPKELQLFWKIMENMTPEALEALKKETEKVKKIKGEGDFFKTQNNQLPELTDKSKEKSKKLAKEIAKELEKMARKIEETEETAEKCADMVFEKQLQVFLTGVLLATGEVTGAERIKNGNTEGCNCRNNWKESILRIGEHAGEAEQKLTEKEAGACRIKK